MTKGNLLENKEYLSYTHNIDMESQHCIEPIILNYKSSHFFTKFTFFNLHILNNTSVTIMANAAATTNTIIHNSFLASFR